MLKNYAEAIAVIQKLTQPNIYEAMLTDIGNVIRLSILSKTAVGFSYLNQRFTPYSEAYKKFKIKRGYSATVNLSLTGQMLGSLEQSVEKRQLTIKFSNNEAAKKAYYNEEGRVPRHFIGVNKDTIDVIDDVIERHINKVLNVR